MQSLLRPAPRSGLFVVLAIALRGVLTLRGDRVLAVTLAAWLGAGAVGVLGGGSYWPHYLIQLVAPASLLAGAALANVRSGGRVAAALAAVAVVGTIGGRRHGARDPASATACRRSRATCAPTRDPATPSTCSTPAPTWATTPASPARTRTPGACWSARIPARSPRLRSLLASPQRPTWIVGWQRPGRWGLDPARRHRAALIAPDYRVVARVHGHAIYHRTSSPRSPP